MAKRRQTHDEELPFVALMDTMTNVVGVLIIVLVMIGISLASSVRKILSELPPVTVEQVQELLKQIADATPKVDPNKLAEENKQLEDQLKKSSDELKTLDLSPEKQNVKMINLDELTKQLEEKKKQRDSKKSEVEKQLAEADRLKALLDATPVYTPPPATVVKLPNPRAIPEKAVMQRFLIVGGRVIYLNDEAFMTTVVNEIEKHVKKLINSEVPVKDKDGNPVMVTERGKQVPRLKTILDQKKISEHFSRLRIATRDLKLELAVSPNSSRIPMKLTPLPDAGESVEQCKNPASVYQRLLRKFKGEPGSVVWFYVFKDSLESYLAVRDFADQLDLPVGWEITTNNFYQRSVNPFEVDYTPPKPPPAGAVRIAPPKTTLD
jgi:Skp family chaperone for outer membrane proteins